MTHKQCTICLKDLPLEDFSPSPKGKYGRMSRCRACDRKKHLDYKNNNREEVRLQGRIDHYRRTYGIHFSDIELYLIEQNNSCYICSTHLSFEDKKIYPQVDHDHKTGKIRKILCSRCNKFVGWIENYNSLLPKALSYIKEHDQCNLEE